MSGRGNDFSSSAAAAAAKIDVPPNDNDRDPLILDDEDAWTTPPHFSPSEPFHRSLRDLDSSFRCPICHDLYTVPVTIDPCRHSFCSECIRRALKEGRKGLRREASCPVCRQVVGSGSSGGFGCGGGDYERCIAPNRGLELAVRRYGAVRSELHSRLVRLGTLEKEAAVAKAERASQKGTTAKVTKKKRGRPRKAEGKATKEDGKKEGGAGDANGEGEEGSRNKRPRRSARNAKPTSSSPTSSTMDEEDEVEDEEDESEEEDDEFLPEIVRKAPPSSTSSSCITNDVTARPSSPLASASVASTDPHQHDLPTHQPPPPRRKRKPTTVYHSLKRKRLAELCQAEGLSTRGSDRDLRDRHAEFITLYNAECDSDYPRSAEELADEIARREKARKEETARSYHTGAHSHATHMERLKRSRKVAGEEGVAASSTSASVGAPSSGGGGSAVVSSGNAAFDAALNNNFRKLIEDARLRGLDGGSKRRGVPSAATKEEDGHKKEPEGGDVGCVEEEEEEKKSGERCDDVNVGGGGGEIDTTTTALAAATGAIDSSPTGVGRSRSSSMAADGRVILEERPPSASAPSPSKSTVVGPSRGHTKSAGMFSSSAAARSSSASSSATPSVARVSSLRRPATTPSVTSICGPWACPTCTFVNEVRKWAGARCEMCNGPRPKAGSPSAAVASRYEGGGSAGAGAVFEIDC